MALSAASPLYIRSRSARQDRSPVFAGDAALRANEITSTKPVTGGVVAQPVSFGVHGDMQAASG